MKTISFIGPRLCQGGEIGGFGQEKQEPQKTIISKIDLILCDLGSEYNLVTSLQAGIETWATYTAIRYNIPFIVVLPFENQESRMPAWVQEKYRSLLSKAVNIQQLSDGEFSVEKLRLKDSKLLESDIIYSFYGRDTKEITKARKSGKMIINPYDPSYTQGETGNLSDGEMIPF